MQKALLFLPDISGFTEFVQQTEVQHSKHIIKELLELLLDQNQIGLELAEVEGDALFFYKIDENLAPELFADQVKQMYEAFHRHLQLYKYRRICNCGACTNAGGLTLKFVVHEAMIDFIEVKNTRKPFGEEVIKVHRLLKNKIPSSEYLLATSEYMDGKSEKMQQLFQQSAQRIEEEFDFGNYRYAYFTLNHFEKNPPIGQIQREPSLGRLLLSMSGIDLIHTSFKMTLNSDHLLH